MSDATAPSTAPREETISCTVDDGFADVLREIGGSLLISTYQANKLIAVGCDGRNVHVLMRDFDRPMGIAVGPETIALGTRREIRMLRNAPQLAGAYERAQPGKYDALFLPRVSYHTGDVGVHEMAFDAKGALWFANTRFSCLCTASSQYSFQPMWKPPFVSLLAPEDRCHLNGIAVRDGRPAYVTCLGATDSPGAWRERKERGGCVVDIAGGETIASGLCMPHSPRWHDGKLWLLSSGTGELLIVPTDGQSTIAVASLPAYVRGLEFRGRYALVGLCRMRERHAFSGLPVQTRHAELVCGVAAIDLNSGQLAGMLRFPSGCTEVFDVRFLSRARRPMILGPDCHEVNRIFTAPHFNYLVRD